MKTKKWISSLLIVAVVLSLCTGISFAQENSGEKLIVVNPKDIAIESEVGSLATKDKAIIILPGILGSTLRNTEYLNMVWLSVLYYSQLKLDEDGDSIYPVGVYPSTYGTQDIYKEIRNGLIDAFGSQFNVILFQYDWRLSNEESARALEEVTKSYSEVVLVAHSMGGLVASRFLTRSANNRAKTKGIITIGTPFAGSAKCLNAMETGELIKQEILGEDFSLYRNTVKEVCQNSYAAYQLLPTSKYYTMTGNTPLSVGGTAYSNIIPQIYNVYWSKKSNGQTKTQLIEALTFHSKLLNANGDLVINWNGVNSYTIAGDGTDTISGVDYTADYKIKGYKYSNSGDGTVLRGSAGYGTPDMTFSSSSGSCEHTALVKNEDVINRVIQEITAMTGISSETMTYTIYASEIMDSNARGWLIGTDNERINIYADQGTELYFEEKRIVEESEDLYTSDGVRVGSVWQLGDTGRKMYALLANDYSMLTTGEVTIEYMNDGYYDKIVEYSFGEKTANVAIGDYFSMNVEAVESRSINNIARKSIVVQPVHTYTETELFFLNQD